MFFVLVKEWNWEKNIGITPDQFTVGSEKKVWWKCNKGHEWQANINARNRCNGCPYCAGRKVLVGFNDLPTANGSLKPENFTANSRKKVWWICAKGHQYQSTISHRTSGRGCPYCASKKVLKGENDLQTVNPSLANEWNYQKNGELKPTDVLSQSNKMVWWKCEKGHEWQARIGDRTHGNGCPYCAGRKVLRGYNDLSTVNPNLVKEWNWEKNVDIGPDQLTAGSGRKIWWKCQKGHEWQTTVAHRRSGQGCPYCAKEKHQTID